MTVRMEVFSGDPPCPGCVAVQALADEYTEQYRGKLEVIKLIGKEAMAKFKEYGLVCTPAVVVNKTIRIKGYAPAEPLWTMQ